MKTPHFLLLLFLFTTAQATEEPIKLLSLGDSYTIGASVQTEERWPNQLVAKFLENNFACDSNRIIATTGWTSTTLLNTIQNSSIDNDYTLVSLLIGVNNFFQSRPDSIYLKELPILLDSAVAYCNNNPSGVFMVSIPDYGHTPFGSNNQASISKDTDRYNHIADSICKTKNIRFINITDISRRGLDEPTLVANDQLHPSAQQYKLWVDRIYNTLIDSALFTTPKNKTRLTFFDPNLNSWCIRANTDCSIKTFDLSGKLITELTLSQNQKHVFSEKTFFIEVDNKSVLHREILGK